MRRAALIHWRPEEGETRLPLLRAAGWEAFCLRPEGGNLRSLRDNPPDAFVIDLSRLPSHGRDVGQALRQYSATRHVPLVFVGGDPDKVQKVRQVLPDAAFCEWDGIAAGLRAAVAAMPDEPIVPQPMAGYAGTPLAKKLGIQAGSRVSVIHAPQGFLQRIALPPGVQVRERAAESERVLFFVRSRRELESGFDAAAKAVADRGGLWVIWPKKASGIETDISQANVREFCMDRGWVDYKICAVDETWSGLLFSRRTGSHPHAQR
jgi:hypothetical protein